MPCEGGGHDPSHRGTRRTESNDSANRAQATVAVVLLFGLTVVAALVVLTVGSSATAEFEQRAQTDRITKGFRALDDDVDAVAYGDGVRVTDFSLPADAGGDVHTADTGRIVVTRSTPESAREVLDVTVGTVSYETGGTTVAYQAGGLWRGTGRHATMLSAPYLGYRDGTLVFRITDLVGDHPVASDSLAFRGRNVLRPVGTVTALKDELVTIRVTSRYYGGWAEYFRQRFPDSTVTVDHTTDTVVVRFGHADIFGDYQPGLVSDGGDITVARGASGVYTRARANGSVNVGPAASIGCPSGTGSDCYSEGTYIDRAELDWGIHERVDIARERAAPARIDGCSGTRRLEAGSYYSDGFLLKDCTLVIDLSEGNVTLAVEGNVGVVDQIRVVNGDVDGNCCYARVYTTGDWAMAGGAAGVDVDSGNATRFQLYGTSEMQFAMGQADGGFTGSIYAPRDDPAEGSNRAVSEYGLSSATAACTGGGGSNAGTSNTGGASAPDVCIGQGNGHVRGAIIAGPAEIQQASSFEYAPELRYVRPTLGLNSGGPDLVYFQVFVHEVAVEDR